MTETAGADDRAAEATTDTALAARRTTAGANAREVLESESHDHSDHLNDAHF